jgi:hypothetical protein
LVLVPLVSLVAAAMAVVPVVVLLVVLAVVLAMPFSRRVAGSGIGNGDCTPRTVRRGVRCRCGKFSALCGGAWSRTCGKPSAQNRPLP